MSRYLKLGKSENGKMKHLPSGIPFGTVTGLVSTS